MFTLKSILVPVDFSEPSDAALATAVELAKQYNATLTIVHVFDLPPAYAGMDVPPMDLMAPMVEAARKELDAKLAEVRASLPSAQIVMGQGAPWREILAAAEDTHADLIVVGTHGRGGIKRVVLGSVAERVVRHSPVPVLTIRPRATKGGAE